MIILDIMLKNIVYLIESKYKNDIDFEKDFGIARSTVSAWRKGKLKSYKKMSNEIATFFGVSIDWLYGNEQKNKLSPEEESLSDMDKEMLSLFKELGERDRKLALAQLRTMLSVHEDSTKK